MILITIGSSIAEIVIRSNEADHSLWIMQFLLALKDSPYPLIWIIGGLVSTLFVILLCLFHHRIIFMGRTTNEHLKRTHTKSFAPNPYDKGYFINLWMVLSTGIP